MTSYRVYLGEAINPARSWRELGDDWQDDVRELLDLGGGMSGLHRVTTLIDEGVLMGRQVDWGAWIAAATKQELFELYPRREVEKLPDGDYLLVLIESI